MLDNRQLGLLVRNTQAHLCSGGVSTGFEMDFDSGAVELMNLFILFQGRICESP